MTGQIPLVESSVIRITRILTVVGLLVSVSSAAPDSLDGVWRSEGYGYVFVVKGPTLRKFEITATTCVPTFTARRRAADISAREATFYTKDGDEFFVRTEGASNRKLLHSEGAASDIRIDRLPKMPHVCDRPTPNTPGDNFEVFSRTWAEHYISFELKQIDWNRIVAEARQRVTSRTSPSDLFQILQSMIKTFGDAHTFINGRSAKRMFHGIRPGTDRVAKNGLAALHGREMHELLSGTDRVYLKAPVRKFCNDQIEYGHIDASIGYLRIWSFSGYSKERGFIAGEKALEAALDEIFSDPKLGALVIDVRINFGGEDPYGLEIASRLTNTQYVAYTKYARADAVDRATWTHGDESVIRPSSRPGFRGPIVELTGPLTISAGETFTQALMGRTPHVMRIGENTQGVFSDVLVRKLPNGWFFGLPNEVYRTPEGTAFDGAGIPPDIAVPVFADEDIIAGRDPGVAKAVEILRNATEAS